MSQNTKLGLSVLTRKETPKMANRNPNGKGVQPSRTEALENEQPFKSTSLSIVFVTVGLLLVASFIHFTLFGSAPFVDNQLRATVSSGSSNCRFR